MENLSLNVYYKKSCLVTWFMTRLLVMEDIYDYMIV